MDFQKAFDDCFETVKGYVDRSFLAIHKRIDALESRAPERGEKGDRGEAGLPGANGIGIADAMIDREGGLVVTLSDGRTKTLGLIVGADGASGQPGKDGKDGLTGDKGADGRDGAPGERGESGEAGKDGRDGADGLNGKDGADGKDGKDIDPEFVREVLAEFVAALPTPKDGKDGRDGEKGLDGKDGTDGKDGIAGRDGLNGKDGLNGLNGKDGLDAVSFVRDANGHLIAAMSDGTTKDLGLVTGADGRGGKDGIAGLNGKDGVDGFGFDDLTVEHDGLRKFTFKFAKGERVRAFDFTVPVMIDAGIYKADAEYEHGDVVSHGGSMWIAQRSTADRPGEGDAWRLSVKRGKDGRDLMPKEEKTPEPIRLR